MGSVSMIFRVCSRSTSLSIFAHRICNLNDKPSMCTSVVYTLALRTQISPSCERSDVLLGIFSLLQPRTERPTWMCTFRFSLTNGEWLNSSAFVKGSSLFDVKHFRWRTLADQDTFKIFSFTHRSGHRDRVRQKNRPLPILFEYERRHRPTGAGGRLWYHQRGLFSCPDLGSI